MKIFKNQQTSITMEINSNEKKEMTYVDLANLTLNIPPQNGAWDMSEMRIRFKIEDKIEMLNVGDEIELEDAEHDKLFDLSNQPWQFKHRDLLKYLDDLELWNKK